MANSHPFNNPQQFPLPPLPFSQLPVASQSLPGAQSASSDPRQASINNESFQYNGGLPGLNMQSFAPTAQSAQYPYWPPPPGTPQNTYGNLPFPIPFLQNGIPIPPPPPPPLPPPPGTNFFPPGTQPVAHHTAPGATNMQPAPQIQPSQQPPAPIQRRVVGVVETDKEDGEVSESDPMARPSANKSNAFGLPPRPGSNAASHNKGENVVQSPYARSGVQTPQASTPTSASRDHLNHVPMQLNPPARVPTEEDHLQKREMAKQFLQLLCKNNIGYPMLTAEGLEPDRLADMYRDLNLPLENNTSPKTLAVPGLTAHQPVESQSSEPKEGALKPSAPPATNGQTTQPKPSPTVKTNVVAANSSRNAPSPSDRKDYIARLQAAKAAKQAPKIIPSHSTPPSLPEVNLILAAPPSNQSLAGTPNSGSDTTNTDKAEEERRRKNDLLRQRLAMLTQKQIALKPATSDALQTEAAPSPAQPSQPKASQQPNVQSSQSAPQTPSLPGLFMNGPLAPTPQAPTPNKFPPPPQNSINASGRKRPVASDFDEATTPRSRPIYTRPLGQSPYEHDSESMIIEVSDDEGSDMDLDDDQADAEPTILSPPAPAPSISQSTRNLPPLSSFPSRSGSVRPSPAISTPPAGRTPAGSLAYQEEALRKETEIAKMKLRIAEIKRKRQEEAAKKEAIGSSPAPTQNATSQVGPNGANVSLQPSPQLATPSHANTRATPGPLQRTMTTEWKRQRRVEIESGLQSLDHGLQSRQARLAQLEAEMAEIRAQEDKAQQDRQKLIEELENLGIDTEGLPVEELQAKKDEIIQNAIEARAKSPVAGSEAAAGVNAHTHDGASGSAHETTDALNPEAPAWEPSSSVENAPHQTPEQQAIAAVASAETNGAPTTTEMSASGPEKAENSPSTSGHPAANDPMSEAVKLTVDAGSSVKDMGEPAQANTRHSSTPMDDGEDFYSPEPAVVPITNPPASSTNVPEKCNVDSPSEEGELDMSESSSSDEEMEEYEPEEPQQPLEEHLSTPENPQADLVTAFETEDSSSSDSSTEDEGEVHEQPDAENHIPETPNDLPADEEGGVEEMDISMSSPEELTHTKAPSPSSKTRSSAPFGDGDLSSIAIIDELTPASQRTGSPTAQLTIHEPPSIGDGEPDRTRFVPYESPLKMFKSYRYHPNFAQEVDGGFLSMTYSHQIDPHKPLCRFESVGGTCNDPDCPDQHFRGMNITGEKLLVQLGTANPGKTPQERQQWNDGLRLVLKDLRQNNTKDPNGIALEIAKYRRRFFDDDTRVVNL